jgi:hypothetical protein
MYVAWLTPHAAIFREGERAVDFWNDLDIEFCRYCFCADGKDIFAVARSAEHLLEICDVVLRLLAVSVVHLVEIETWGSPGGGSINASALAYLMERCQYLKVLSLNTMKIDENNCRVLGDYSRPRLEIILDCCKITSAGADALAEGFGRNQGPTKIDLCEIDNVVLANGLRGNSRLKSLRPRFSSNRGVGNQELLAIAGAVKENKGLVDLDLRHSYSVNDVAWDAISDSLKAHPTLEFWDLRAIFTDTATAQAVLTSQIQALSPLLLPQLLPLLGLLLQVVFLLQLMLPC